MRYTLDGVIKKQNKALKIFEKVKNDLTEVIDTIGQAQGECHRKISEAEATIKDASTEDSLLTDMANVNRRRIEKISELLEG